MSYTDVPLDVVEEAERAQVETLLIAQAAVDAIGEKLLRPGTSHCEECGDKIPVERRAAYPSAKTCVSCQEFIEKFFADR